MPSDLLQQNIAPILGIDALSDDEQAVFLMNIGDLIMESALLRLVADLNDDQESALNHYLETEPSGEVLMEHICTQHKNFEKILEEEIIAFKEEALAVMGNSSEHVAHREMAHA